MLLTNMVRVKPPFDNNFTRSRVSQFLGYFVNGRARLEVIVYAKSVFDTFRSFRKIFCSYHVLFVESLSWNKSVNPLNRKYGARTGTQRRLLLGPPATENEGTVGLEESRQLAKTFPLCPRRQRRNVVGSSLAHELMFVTNLDQ